ncbi:outer membrane beta-barrel protein [Cucumibacter marinus]|uniref:outer membrane beta-barrel protein n=1 Tax=Cucumibacter marinus TaxID=1121252 RepID=UPI0003F72B52|nr:outer membrane beta-barrel protein [Cucumibacter marinus]
MAGINPIKCVGATGIALLLSSVPGFAGPFGDGVGTDNPDLLYPAFAGKCTDQAGEVIACDTGAEQAVIWNGQGPITEITRDLTISAGTSNSDADGGLLILRIRPGLGMNYGDEGDGVAASIGADLRRGPGDSLVVDGIDGSFEAGRQFGDQRSIATTHSLGLSVGRPGEGGVPDDAEAAPVSFDWDGTVTGQQDFGGVALELRLNGARHQVTDTVLADLSTVDNAEQRYWRYGGGGRVSAELTPILSVFADYSFSRTLFDAPSTSLGAKLDGNTETASLGLAASRDETLSGEFALTALRRSFDDPGLDPVIGTGANGSVRFVPTDGVVLTASAAKSIAPTEEDGASAAVTQSIDLTGEYLLTDTITLRGSAGYSDISYPEAANRRYETRFGLGVDHTIDEFTRFFANYGYSKNDDLVDGIEEVHSIEAGVAISR